MKVYVSSKFENYKKVIELQNKIVDQGHLITYNWAENVAVKVLGPGKDKPEIDHEYKRNCYVNDRVGVESCHIFVLLWYEGVFQALLETGMALGWGKIIYVLNCPKDKRDAPFWTDLRVKLVSEGELLATLGVATKSVA